MEIAFQSYKRYVSIVPLSWSDIIIWFVISLIHSMHPYNFSIYIS